MRIKLKSLFYFLTITFSVVVSSCYGQDLNYFVIGEEELKNAEIYSILQTKDLKLYVTTNEGLYRYKHGKMSEVPSSKEQKGISLFNLIENKKGDVFCYNLSGQIFTIQDGNLKLFQTIPENLMSSNMSMVFDEDDNLIIGSKGCFIVTNNEIKPIYQREDDITQFSKLPDGRIFISGKKKDSLFQISRGKVIPNFQDFKSSSKFNSLVYILGEKLISIDRLNKITNENTKKDLSSLTKYVQFNNDIIWRQNYRNGIETLVFENEKIVVKESFFTNTFISYIAKGKNGELFLGTFGKGLFVVPNKNTVQYTFLNKGNNIQSIAADSSGLIFISDRINGILSYYNNELKEVKIDYKYIPENIFSVENFNTKISKKFPTLFFNNSSLSGALKNVDKVDYNTILLSTSTGLIKIGNSKVLSDSIWKPIAVNKFLLKGDKTRCLDAIFIPSEDAIYLSSISSLNRISNDGSKEVLKLNDRNLIANDLLAYNDEVWAATQNQGIVIFKKGRIHNIINIENGLANNYVKKIEEKNGLVYISTRTSFQIYNTENGVLRTIGFAEGIKDGSVKDFTLAANSIWLATNNKLVSIPTNFKTVNIDLEFKIDSIKVNHNHLNKISKNSFSFKENKLSVFPDFRIIPYQNEAIYSYQLIGFDDDEKLTSVTEPKIHYDYLPSGDYTFLLNVKYRDLESPKLAYSFSIKKPYWQTWWFYLSLFLILIAILFFYSLNKNERLKKLNEEKLLKQSLEMNSIESELRALRSQMNPHFIFNSLNSIQDLILMQDTNASYDYIVLFSDLVRNSLNYSNRQSISLEEEIGFLNTYLKLEKLRFGDDFQYHIINNGLVDRKIPSLVIQPFVENAIVHGLFHKKGKKVLNIEFTPYSDGLQCTITDNGIGRQKAIEIQKRQGEHHSSYAMGAIKKRLKILEEKYNKTIGYVVKDLNSGKAASGTQIVITFPNIPFFK